VIEENITDVDGTRVGTLEVDLAGAALAPHGTGSGSWSSELEAEWRPIDRLGVGASLSAEGTTTGLGPDTAKSVFPRVAASYVIVRDRTRKIFLQPEAFARYEGSGASRELTDSALPYGVGVRFATEIGRLTLRSSLFAEAGGPAARAPIRQGGVFLVKCVDARVGVYLGGELIEDFARTTPTMVVPELLLLARVFDQPMRLGAGVPAVLGAGSKHEIGVVFRLVFEPDE
jgi:hypothetical protein